MSISISLSVMTSWWLQYKGKINNISWLYKSVVPTKYLFKVLLVSRLCLSSVGLVGSWNPCLSGKYIWYLCSQWMYIGSFPGKDVYFIVFNGGIFPVVLFQETMCVSLIWKYGEVLSYRHTNIHMYVRKYIHVGLYISDLYIQHAVSFPRQNQLLLCYRT